MSEPDFETIERLEKLVAARTAELKRVNEQLQQEIEERKQAEMILRKSEAKNRALINAIPDMMFRISKGGTYLEFKAAKGLEPLVPPTEFLGKTVAEVLPPALAQQTMHYIAQALECGEVQIFEYQLPVKGKVHHYEARLVASGVQADEVLAIVRDITQRKERESLIEAERGRIARDLHAGLAQSLYQLGLNLDYSPVQARALGRNCGEPDMPAETIQSGFLPDASSEAPGITPLTGLELEILRLTAQGLSNTDIGDQLGLAKKTVSNRMTMIFNKLNVDNRVQAALFALRQGFVDLDE